MKKFYSFVLMAMMLLVGTNAWANYPAGWLQQQFDNIQADGQTHTIVMGDDIILTDPVYLGTATVDEDRKSIILDMHGHNITMDATTWSKSENHKGVFCSVFNITHGELLIKNSQKSTTTSLIQFTGTGSGNYNDIFNIAGSYKSSRWVKNGSVYEINESAAKNTRDADGGWFTHLVIDEGVKLYAPNTVFGAGISIDGYYTNFRGQVSATASVDSVFGKTSLKGSAGSLCLTGRTDAPRYNTAIMSAASNGTAEGFGYGVRVEVYGDIEFASGATKDSDGKSYGIKLNGGLRSTLKTGDYFHPDYCKNMDEAYIATYGATEVTQNNLVIDSVGTYRDHYFNHRDDTIDAPFLYIGKTAHIIAAAELNEATAVYCSGYGKTLIEGACSGNSGVNVKSGTVELHDAEITCTATATSVYAAKNGNNATGTGAVVVNSVDGRAGGIEVIISGDSKVSTDYGYAIAETVNTITEGTKVSSITIDGGTIQGGASSNSYDGGAIIISEKTKGGEVVVYGTNLTGNTKVQVGGDGDLDELTPNDVIVTEVIVDGKPTVVVSQGETPGKVDDAATDSKHSIMNATGTSITWTGVENQIIDGNKTLDYLEMNLTTGTTPKTPVPQQLTIESGYTLTVGRVVLGEAAVIIVKPGAKFIVTGTQGILAPKAANIKLETSESSQAIFLIHPNVASNRHPNATVEFISNSITDNPFYSKQRFGIPTWKQLTSITTKNGGSNVQTAISSFNYADNDWHDIGWINVPGKQERLDTINHPFEYYQMQHNTVNPGTVVTMTGELYGNSSPAMEIRENSWNGYANSYMAPIDAAALIGMIPTTVDRSFQLYELPNEAGQRGSWKAVSGLLFTDIKPMQAFLIRNTKAAADVTIEYWDAVYTPMTGEHKPTSAPARQKALNDITKVQLIVKGENCVDYVVVAEDDQFSAEYDNGYEAVKYMNDGINMYVSANEKMAHFATDNLENTYVGLQTVNGGNYTIEFDNVQGEELTLIDHETNAQVAMVAGNTYEFTAAANSVNDYRFEIVGAAKMPTALENAEAVKSAKGIYTITGQYLGEMNVWNTLPAGVYVVNGAKRVK